MAVSARTQEITGLSEDSDREGDYIIDRTARGKWRIYHEDDGYSSAGGQTIGKGKVLRDFDGCIVEMPTKEQAIEYARNLAASEKADVNRARQARADKAAKKAARTPDRCAKCGIWKDSPPVAYHDPNSICYTFIGYLGAPEPNGDHQWEGAQ